MIAAVVNAVAVFVGSLIGILFKKGISESIQQAIMKAMGLITLLLAFQNALKTQDTLCVIICLVIGTIIGELLHIDDGLNKCGDALKARLLKDKSTSNDAAGGDSSGSRFTEGFVTTCILFCVGSMTLLGSIQAGINHDYSLIFAKSVMDFVSAIVFGAAMGYGVTCTSVFVLVFQGIITLAASGLAGVLTDAVITEMSAVGGVILIGMGINILGLTDKPIKVSNMLPGIFLPAAYLAITNLL